MNHGRRLITMVCCYIKPHVPEKISMVISNLPQGFINLDFLMWTRSNKMSPRGVTNLVILQNGAIKFSHSQTCWLITGCVKSKNQTCEMTSKFRWQILFPKKCYGFEELKVIGES